jgi:hypothetical protein
MAPRYRRAVDRREAPTVFTDFVGQTVVIDLTSPYVCMGKLEKFDDYTLWLRDADLHDLRDSDSTRENYVAASRMTGIKRNRKHLRLVRAQVVAISRLADVVDE